MSQRFFQFLDPSSRRSIPHSPEQSRRREALIHPPYIWTASFIFRKQVRNIYRAALKNGERIIKHRNRLLDFL